MLATYIKYFFIILCSLFTYSKLTQAQGTKLTIRQHIIFSIFSTLFTVLIRYNLSVLTIIAATLSIIIYFKIIYNSDDIQTVTYSIISLSISNFIYYLATLLLIPFFMFLFFKINDETILDIISSILTIILQIFILFLLFKNKRFKKGLPKLENFASNYLGLSLSIILLITISFFYLEQGTSIYFITLYLLSIFLGILLILWWRTNIKNTYLRKIKQREIENLEKIITELKGENANLKTYNNDLAKIIHKDNKLIPAMEMAVREIINSNSTLPQEKTLSLISQLDELSYERKGILHNYEAENRTLASTKIASTDALLSYLLCRGNETHVNFDISVNCRIDHFIFGSFTENDLNTLIADLGENALIAASESLQPTVLITFNNINDSLCISFYDNGAFFDRKALKYMGRKQYTTHAKTGGSGIGMLAVFEVINKHHASFELNESINDAVFTKKISVTFDRKHVIIK